MGWKGWDAQTISYQEDEIEKLKGLLKQCLPILKNTPLVGADSLNLPDMSHQDLCKHIFALIKAIEAETQD